MSAHMSATRMRNTVPGWAADLPECAETLQQLSLPFYCCNCYRKRTTTYLTSDFGPFCDECIQEVSPLLPVAWMFEWKRTNGGDR